MTAARSDCLRAPVWADVCCSVSVPASSRLVPAPVVCLSPSAAALSHVISLPEGLAFTGLLLVPGEEERAAWQDQVSPSPSAQRGPPPTFPEQGTRQDREGWSPQEGSELCLPRARLVDTDLRAALCTLDVVCSGRWGLRCCWEQRWSRALTLTVTR